ncbi:MAG TPA: SDR family oxidoreductase [Solirubrobacteraceae bacterium]|nr:SDR family oxidoreductase [Solirubrobacteraceae bacterium]
MSLPTPSESSAALITGASAGIGAEIARELARRGHNLVLVARSKDKLTTLGRELSEAHGVRAESVSCDLGKLAARGRLPDRLEKLGLSVDVLINNAGFATGGPFHASDPERELEQVRLDVEAVVSLSSTFIPPMVERGAGAVLNVASTAGMQPMPYSAGYGAAKAYVLSFSEALHYELAPEGVTVTALAPGPVSTEFWSVAGWQTTGGQSFEQAVPGPVWVSAQDAARAAVRGLESGARVVVPGLPMRAAMLASRYIPHAIKLPSIAAAMRRR